MSEDTSIQPSDTAPQQAGDQAPGTAPGAAEPDVMDLFDEPGTDAGSALVCRVCGSLVAGSGPSPRAHWDWHEASNGA